MLPRICAAACLVLVCSSSLIGAHGDDTRALDHRIDRIETQLDQSDSQLTRLEKAVSELEGNAAGGAVLFLFGIFCALWAQNTGRNPWLWFFLGLLLSIITVLFLLEKNSTDIADKRSSGELKAKT